MRTAMLLLLLAAACGGSPPPASSPAPSNSAAAASDTVDGKKAHDLVAAGAVLVDVRSADEFAEKHIDGAINVPLEAVASHDFGGKDKSLVFYCTAGHRSSQAVDTLRKQGYTHVYLLGPMSAWSK
jgi:phage shock protein E